MVGIPPAKARSRSTGSAIENTLLLTCCGAAPQCAQKFMPFVSFLAQCGHLGRPTQLIRNHSRQGF
jgi:hypothetical protein